MTLEGVVVRGEGLGAKLGFPTANLSFSGLSPARGVWAVAVDGPGLTTRPAVCNVGVRPTVSQRQRLTVEVHIPGFAGDLYGQKLSVRFVRKIREERRFASVDELKEHISRDLIALGEPAMVHSAGVEKLNHDGNLLGRLCALALIVAVVVALGRICGFKP